MLASPCKTHGGKRLGAGRKPTNIDEKRMMLLIAGGCCKKTLPARLACLRM
jgi:hypothetical protein